VITEFRWI